MTPIWNSRFWLDIVNDVVGVWQYALPMAAITAFLSRVVNGAMSALDPDPVLLGLAVIAIIFDTATGCYKAATNGNLTFNGDSFGRIVDKLIKYAVLILVFSAIAGAGEKGEFPEWAFTWIRDFGYMVVIVRDGMSAIENAWGQPIGELMPQWKELLSDVSK